VKNHTPVGSRVQGESGNWLTLKDLQHELRLGEKAVYRLLRSGTIPSVRLGGVYRVHRRHLEEAFLVGTASGKSA
jgi:excisionase family DNA binding protein